MIWQDRERTDPTKRKFIDENGNEQNVNIEEIESNITQSGTPVNARTMNNIEQNLGTYGNDTYDSTATYLEGETVTHNALLYRAKQDIETPEEWTAAHWEQTSALQELANTSGNEIAIGTEEDITRQTKALIKRGNYRYINSEIAIGSSNNDNRPVWFKKGKNLFSSSLELGTFSNDGVKSGSTTNYRSASMVAIQPSTTYTFSINGTAQAYAKYFYDKNMAFISADTEATFTTPNNAYYLNMRCFNADWTSDYANLKIQLEQGSTATPYEDYIAPSIIADNTEFYSKPEMTYGTGTINSNYIGNVERNNYYKNGNLVCFVCGCTANATWTGQAEIISNLPKPIRNFNFIGFNANQALPIRFELTTNGVLRKYYSNNGVVNSDVVDIYITYFTTD